MGRRRGARVPAVLRADVVGDRGRARHRRARLRLARRRGRLVGDQRRDDLAARGARREVRDRRARRVARRARGRRHRHARRRAGGRRADRRRPHAAPDRAGADEVPPRPRDVQGRLRDPGRRALDARGVAPRRHGPRRRQLPRDRGRRGGSSPAARCPTGRSCSSASSTSRIPSRSDGDVHPLYAYAHVPAGYTGDVTAQIEAQIERFAPGFRERILARHVRSVAQMEAHNVNYVGGDVVTGSNDPRQLVFRPRAALDPYTTGIPGVYLCSAATPPGAGAHGMCGYNAAQLRAAAHRADRSTLPRLRRSRPIWFAAEDIIACSSASTRVRIRPHLNSTDRMMTDSPRARLERFSAPPSDGRNHGMEAALLIVQETLLEALFIVDRHNKARPATASRSAADRPMSWTVDSPTPSSGPSASFKVLSAFGLHPAAEHPPSHRF